MRYTRFGRTGFTVSTISMGCNRLGDPGVDPAQWPPIVQRALDLGVTHIDTAEIYGPYANEELVGRAIKDRRDHVVLATKFGIVSHAGGGPGVLELAHGRHVVGEGARAYDQRVGELQSQVRRGQAHAPSFGAGPGAAAGPSAGGPSPSARTVMV